MMMTSRHLCVAIALVLVGFARVAGAADELSLRIDYGPLPSMTSQERTISVNAAARWKKMIYDAQAGGERRVRGFPLAELIKKIAPPKEADALVFNFVNGMQVLVRLADRSQIAQLFVVFEDVSAMDEFSTEQCPRIAYQRVSSDFTIWRFVNQLGSIRVVNHKLYQSLLAQPSRQLPTHQGWRLYERNCQSCHGIGGQGAKRGPDFISDLDAYRRVPPLALTALGEAPSLHEKVTGQVPGQMPELKHIPKAEIAALWQWLHQVHAGATK